MNKIKNLKFIIVILALVIMLFNIAGNCFAISSENVNIKKIRTAGYHLKYYRDERGYSTYIICSIVGYEENGKFFPAYCMNRDLAGVDEQGYNVNVKELTNNDAVWRVVTNGYPYKSANQMGLQYDDDAFVVTKMALYCVLGQGDVNKYSAPEDDEIAKDMLNCLRNLVNIGLNGTETKKDGTMQISEVGNLNKTENYYFQEYSVSSSVNMSGFEASLEGFPEGTYISGIDGNRKNNFSTSENFRVYIPEESLDADVFGKINIKGKCETYPIFYGESNDPTRQNYLLTCSSFDDEQMSVDLKVSAKIGKVKIVKKDSKSQEPLEGVKFNIVEKDTNNIIETLVTDEKGEAESSNLRIEKNYFLQEAETLEGYILNTETIEFNVKENEVNEITIENEKEPEKPEEPKEPEKPEIPDEPKEEPKIPEEKPTPVKEEPIETPKDEPKVLPKTGM